MRRKALATAGSALLFFALAMLVVGWARGTLDAFRLVIIVLGAMFGVACHGAARRGRT